MGKKTVNDIYIVVNKGGYESVELASKSDTGVSWWDDGDENAAVCTHCFAAVELRQHLCKIAGVDENDVTNFPFCGGVLPDSDCIVIADKTDSIASSLLGDRQSIANVPPSEYPPAASSQKSDAADSCAEGFAVRTVAHGEHVAVLLAGNSRVGTLYAVYSFLESMGVRWYGLGAKGTHYTVIQPFELPKLDYVDYPKFKTRGCYSEIVDDTSDEFVDWLARNRINFAFLYEIKNPHRLKKRGISICTGGHNILDRFLNPNQKYKRDGNSESSETYFEAHPEWFGMVGGRRSDNVGNGGKEGFGDNYCTSNQDATSELCKNIVASLASGELGTTDYLNFWMLDNGNWCECNNCQRFGNFSYRLAILVHALRKEIESAMKKNILKRNVKILFPAYHETLEPPDKPLPTDFDYENCTVTYFPIERCYVHDIDDLRCTETNQELMQTYSQWTGGGRRTYKGEIFVGEYYNVSSFAGFPIPHIKSMAHDIPYYYSTGVRHMYYMHMTSAKWGTLALTNYQFYKMLWNPHLDVCKLTDEYYKCYYNDNLSMKAFYQTLEVATRNMKYFKHYQYHKGVRHSLAAKLNNGDCELFPLKHMQYDFKTDDLNAGISVVETVQLFRECRQLIDDAIMEATSEAVATRILEDEMRFTYGEDIVFYMYYMVRVNLFRVKKQQSFAARSFERAHFYAEKLQKNVEVMEGLKKFDNMKNGLVATWCSEAYERCKEMYGGEGEVGGQDRKYGHLK